jgi:hypothetical protein
MHALRFDPLNILAVELVHYTGNKQCSSADEKLFPGKSILERMGAI